MEQKDQNPKTKAKKVAIRGKKCSGGQCECKNYVGNYKDVEGVGCCEQCDKYIDDNPYDPYWEHMEQDFEFSKECEELEQNGLLKDNEACEKAFEKYQETYEPWPVMRRRMAKKCKLSN
uniref:Uncharacterized protein n=1 Tax=viral metagenome TaxID=1070528 RepID=A0A6C0F4W3_9ZZZZ